jgi:hypothetical protein
MEPSSIRNPGQPRCGAISPRLVIVMAAVVFLGTAGSLWATPPSWWSGYGVLNGNAANDYAVANQGQAKNIAVAAVQEMDNDLAQFGGSGLDGLAATLLSGSASSNDYAAVNLGQLKALTQPFYDRLLSLGYTGSPLTSGTYPWAASSQAPNDYAAANIGQVKNAFSFDVTLSSDGSGVPDWWEQKYSVSGTGTVIWSGGQVTDLQAYQQGLNPIDFYNGQSFTLAIVSGTNQTGSPGGYLPLPMTVVVTGSGGAGIPGAPVTFEVASGGGYVQAPGAVAASGSATVLADGNGQAQVYFLLSSASNNTSQITATTGTGSSAQQVEFTEYSDDGTGQFASLFAPSNCIGTVNSDGSYTLAWTNNTNGIELYIDIEQQQSDGSWQVISSELPAGTASYSVVSPTGSGQYRAETHIPDALNPSGDPTYAGPPFLFGISVLSYAAIDMSGTTTNGNPVNYATIDDFGNIAYGFFTGQLGTYGPSLSPMSYSTQFASYTWSNGIAHPSTILPMTGSNATQTYSVTLNSNMESTSDNLEIDATGDIWGGTGVIDTTITGTTTSTSNGFVSGTSAGTGTVFGNTIPIPNPPYGPSTFPGVPGQPSSSILELTSTANYAGYAAGFLPDYQTAYSDYFIFHAGIYHIFNFNDSLTQADLQSGAQLEPDDFIPAASADHLTPHLLNDNGWALGYSYDFLSEAVWNGTTVIPLPDYPAALNNQGYVIGNQGTPSDGSATSYVWTSLSGSATPMTQLIPQPYEKQLTNIQSLDISGSDANGTVHVLFRANYQTVTTGSTALGLFMLNLLSGTTPTLAQISLPSNVPNYAEGPQFILNPQMLMTTIGDITTVNSSGIATTGTQRALLLLPVELAVDGNRDGTITLSGSGGSDQTTEDKPYRFWVNDNQDSSSENNIAAVGGVTVTEGEVVPVATPDYTDPNIQCKRDLEDWARLWISLKGDATLIKAMVQNGDSVGLQFEAVSSTESTPTIKICEAVETTGSTGYVNNDGSDGGEDWADQQITGSYDVPIEDPNGNSIIGSSPFMLPSDFWDDVDDNTPKHLIFEGCSEGEGKLTLVFYDSNGNKIGEGGAVYLDIKNIKRMYVRAKGTPENGIPSPYNSLSSSVTNQRTSWESDPDGYPFAQPWDETSQAIVFVHGINPPFTAAAQSYLEKIDTAETVFKRLWWRGYKGRFAFYEWPALNPAGIGSTGFNFNESEYRGWKYGQGLASFVQNGLPSQYTKNLFAHSQGNTVCGAALSVYGLHVANYALTQAAVPAGCYATGTNINRYPLFLNAEATSHTPDQTNDLGYRGYLNPLNVTGIVVNFENYQDFALATGVSYGVASNWEADQLNYKPNTFATVTYAYDSGPPASPYPAGQRCFLRQLYIPWNQRSVTDIQESMGFVARPRSKAVGAEDHGYPLTGGSVTKNVDLSVAPYNFSNGEDDHGGQWSRRNQQTWQYYQELLNDLTNQ